MRRKGESLFDCLERKGFRHVRGPLSIAGYSKMVPDGIETVYSRGDKVFRYGIKPNGSVGPLSPIPKCCADHVPLFRSPSLPAWLKWCLNVITGERKRQRQRKAHRDAVLSWLRMDLRKPA